MSCTYVPGHWALLAGQDLTLFTDARPDTRVVRECWRLVDGGATVDDVLGAIVHEGLRAIGAFVLASRDRVLVRGEVAVARVDRAGERQSVEWEAAPTWREIAFDAPAMRLAVPAADADAPVLPLSQGIALASVVVVSTAGTGVERAREKKAETVSPARPASVAASAEAPEPAAAAGPPVMQAPVVPRAEQRPVPAAPSADEPHGESRQYDELFTPSTKLGSIPAPGIENTVRLAPGRAAVPRVAAPRDQPPPRVPPSPAPTPPGFINHLPWAPVGRATEVPPPPVRQTEPGATLQRPPRTMGRGERVQAVRCPAAHPNPVTAERCRVCHAPITDRETAEINRPRLGVLRLSTDPEPIALERGVVLGREPTTRADVDRIALRQPDISANHVEIRLAGWQVLVVDLGSRNGTVVTAPDGGAIELSPHVPVELCHGTEVALSDEISFRFEVTS